jgi:hypothetical protein
VTLTGHKLFSTLNSCFVLSFCFVLMLVSGKSESEESLFYWLEFYFSCSA